MKESLLEEIATYLVQPKTFPQNSLESARLAFSDAIGCAALGSRVAACKKLIPPWYEEERLTPLEEAFKWTLLIRWLDYNDTWLAKEWAHPSDNLGPLLALMKEKSFKDLFNAMIEAYEIQGVLSLSWSCNERGLDHTYFLKIASGAVAAKLLGGGKKEILATLSHLFIDGAPLRIYRQAPNTTSRKSWAAADAVSRALYLAMVVSKGEEGIPFPLTTPKWGVETAFFGGEKLSLNSSFGHTIIDNILFKVKFPIEFHAQTAVEAAFRIKRPVQEIEKIVIYTHAAAKKIIDKTGMLTSPADRDHCLQYGVAIALLFGDLKTEDFEDDRARDPRIDALREKMVVIEDPHYTKLYHLEGERSIPNRLEVYTKNVDDPEVVEVVNPLGHPKRRKEALPFLDKKLRENLSSSLGEKSANEIHKFLNSQGIYHLKIKDFLRIIPF